MFAMNNVICIGQMILLFCIFGKVEEFVLFKWKDKKGCIISAFEKRDCDHPNEWQHVLTRA